MKLDELRLDIRNGVARFAEEIERQLRMLEHDTQEYAFLPLLRQYKRAKRKFRNVQIERDREVAQNGEIEDEELSALMKAAAGVAACGFRVASFYEEFRREEDAA